MAEFKITHVSEETNDWNNNYGNFRSFLVRFDDDDQQVELSRKLKPDGSVKEPKVGDVLPGELVTKPNGMLKFKQDYGASSGGGSSSSSGQSNKPDDAYWAKHNAKIISQSSRRDAIAVTKLEMEADIFKPKDTEEMAKRIKSWKVRFEKDAHSAEPPKEETKLEDLPF